MPIINQDCFYSIVIGSCWTNFCLQKFKRRILAEFGFNRMALRATQSKLHTMFCAHFLKTALSASWCRLATSELRFGTVGILFVGLQTIDNVIKNLTDCVGYCMASRGSHLNEIIFHYYWLQFQIKKEFEKIFSSFFKTFSKKKFVGGPCIRLIHFRCRNWAVKSI